VTLLAVALAATIRGLPFPAGATIDTEAGGAAVTANAHGVVAASVGIASRNRIIVWDASNRNTVRRTARSSASAGITARPPRSS
jgi:hypothetical protein